MRDVRAFSASVTTTSKDHGVLVYKDLCTYVCVIYENDVDVDNDNAGICFCGIYKKYF